MSVHFLDPIDTKAELEAGKTENDILNMLYEKICTKGSEVMGFDVRDHSKEADDSTNDHSEQVVQAQSA
jgi:hypothetical protein